MSSATPEVQHTTAAPARKLKVATVSLAGCFGCHMSFLDIDERLLPLLELVEFDRSPLTDIKHCGPCDIGLIEGGVCNAENVHVLREFRANCKVLIALGACAVNGGLPAQRNHLPVADILQQVYCTGHGLAGNSQIPNDPELPLVVHHLSPLLSMATGAGINVIVEYPASSIERLRAASSADRNAARTL